MRYSPMMGPTRWGMLTRALEPNCDLVGLAPTLNDRHGRQRFEVHLSSLLVSRKVVQASVWEHGRSNDLVVELKHIRDFDLSRPGQYAWQREYGGLRPLMVPFTEFFGEPGAIDRLVKMLSRGSPQAYARVTPTGVTIRLRPSTGKWSISDPAGRYAPASNVHLMLSQSIERNVARNRGGKGAMGDLACMSPQADAYRYAGLEHGRRMPTPRPFLHDARLCFPSLTPDRRRLEGDRSTPEPNEDRKEQTMLIPAGTKIVQCQFASSGDGKTYAYYTDLDLAVGDDVVVVSPYDGSYNSRGKHYREDLDGHLVVVRVVSVEETLEAIERVAKWVVQKVDVSAYAGRVATQRQIALLTAKIKKAERAAREKLELEKLRDLSPELGELIDQMKALTGGEAKADAAAA